jgi:hypothetical protein
MLSLEARSLEPIGKLEAEFPYAATLPVYVVLERCLKLHLLEDRKTLAPDEVALDKPVGRGRNKQKLIDVRDLGDASFIRRFLVTLTLHDVEGIYKIPDGKYSKQGNKVFHSDLYLTDQLESDDASRGAANRKYLATAKEHLLEASERYLHRRIISSNGVLRFEG